MNRRERERMEKKAIDALLDYDYIEIIHDVYSYYNQVDVIGIIGGDAVHYQVHFDGDEITGIGCK
jgi:hypothetical protein